MSLAPTSGAGKGGADLSSAFDTRFPPCYQLPVGIDLGERNPLVTLINTARLILVLFVVALIQLFDVNVVALEELGIGGFVYALLLSLLPFDRTRSRNISLLISVLDASFICLLVSRSGEIASPFLVLFVFPMIGLSVLYETAGAIAAAVIFLLYSVFELTMTDYPPEAIRNVFITMCLLSFFALYLGNVGKMLKAERDRPAA